MPNTALHEGTIAGQVTRSLAWLEGVLESAEGGGGRGLLFEYAMLQHGLVCFALNLLAGSD